MFNLFNGWEPKDIVIATVAAYSAIVATYMAILRRREKQLDLKVSVNQGLLIPDIASQISEGFGIPNLVNTNPKKPKTHLFLTAVSSGEIPVTLSSCGLWFSQGFGFEGNFSGTRKLPCKLLFGENCQMWIDPEQLSEQLKTEGLEGVVKLRGYYGDQLGNTYKSKAVKFNVDVAMLMP